MLPALTSKSVAHAYLDMDWSVVTVLNVWSIIVVLVLMMRKAVLHASPISPSLMMFVPTVESPIVKAVVP